MDIECWTRIWMRGIAMPVNNNGIRFENISAKTICRRHRLRWLRQRRTRGREKLFSAHRFPLSSLFPCARSLQLPHAFTKRMRCSTDIWAQRTIHCRGALPWPNAPKHHRCSNVRAHADTHTHQNGQKYARLRHTAKTILAVATIRLVRNARTVAWLCFFSLPLFYIIITGAGWNRRK